MDVGLFSHGPLRVPPLRCFGACRDRLREEEDPWPNFIEGNMKEIEKGPQRAKQVG